MNFWEKIKKPILALAPMAGVTDLAFRELCVKCGADVVYTEMVSIDGLYYDSRKTLELLKTSRKDKPVILQLFGKRPELVAKAVAVVEEAGFDGIDINFGCPAKKVVAHEGGVTLLRNLNLVHELVHAVTESASVPVSVKTRISISKKDPLRQAQGDKFRVTVLDFIDKIKDLPVSALMLHGRSYEGGFTAPIDFEMIKEVKKQFNGIVLGNGNLNTPEDIKEMIDKTGVDGVGLARGIYGKPWLFAQGKQLLKKGKYQEYSLSKIKKVAIEHSKLLYKYKGERGLFEIRKHLTWYFRGFPNASEFRKYLVKVESIDEIKQVLKKIK
jgi:tRNA-dihydrouridine synthase B